MFLHGKRNSALQFCDEELGGQNLRLFHGRYHTENQSKQHLLAWLQLREFSFDGLYFIGEFFLRFLMRRTPCWLDAFNNNSIKSNLFFICRVNTVSILNLPFLHNPLRYLCKQQTTFLKRKATKFLLFEKFINFCVSTSTFDEIINPKQQLTVEHPTSHLSPLLSKEKATADKSK